MKSIKEMYDGLSSSTRYHIHGTSAFIGAVAFSISGTRCLEKLADQKFGEALIEGSFALLFGYSTVKEVHSSLDLYHSMYNRE